MAPTERQPGPREEEGHIASQTPGELQQFVGRNGTPGQLGCSLSTPLNARLQGFGSAGWVEARGTEDAAEYAMTSLKSIIHVDGGERREKMYEPVDSVLMNFNSFADAIEGKAEFMITPEQMVHNAAIMEAVEKSVATNTPEKVL